MMKHSLGTLFAMLAMTGCGTGVESDPRSAGSNDPVMLHDAAHACTDPDGPRHDVTTVADARPLIVGKWIHCTGPTPAPFQDDARGIEILADGTYYVLISDGQGGVVRATGFPEPGRWDLQAELNAVWLDLFPVPTSETIVPVLFEDNPRRFAFSNYTSDLPTYEAIAP